MNPNLFIISALLFINNLMFAQNATFTDHGVIPQNVSIIAPFQSSIFNDGKIFIATTNGIWKNNINTHVWEIAGLQNKTTTFIFKHPTITGKLFAGALINANNPDSLFISNDGGITWSPANNAEEPLSNIVVKPNNPNHLYAGTHYGYNFMISTDGGDNWSYYNNGSSGAVGYAVNLAFIPTNNNQLFYGSENPLDSAQINRYDINNSNPFQLDNYTVIVNSSFWSNRRPNELKTYSYTGNYLYVGQEGAFSKVNTTNINDVTFIYKSEGEPEKPYSYIYGHWTDSNNINHLVFGGHKNGDNTNLMQLYETYDEGVTFHRYTNTFGFNSPLVKEIVEIDQNKLGIIIQDQYNSNVKLIVMETNTLSNSDQQVNENLLQIFPNPTSNSITINSNLIKSNLEITIYNNLGKIVLYNNVTTNENEISIENLTKGIYYLKTHINNKLITKKLIIN